uniref:Uncharacterized protein n=1 Tax=Anguilla anguilla TaxID=7936 RepID=A0A0E9QIP0_ANGAN
MANLTAPDRGSVKQTGGIWLQSSFPSALMEIAHGNYLKSSNDF